MCFYKLKRQANHIKGTRQKNFVTSGEKVISQVFYACKNVKKLKKATVYQKHRSLLICKKMYNG
jgi:hypothetical protein